MKHSQYSRNFCKYRRITQTFHTAISSFVFALRPVVTESQQCNMVMDSGPCHARISRYHYDATDEYCKHFVFGGCKGNTNNFASKITCLKTCRNGSDVGGYDTEGNANGKTRRTTPETMDIFVWILLATLDRSSRLFLFTETGVLV